MLYRMVADKECKWENQLPVAEVNKLRYAREVMRAHSGWKKLYNYVLKSDEEMFVFVKNYFRKALGNRKPEKKKRKKKK